MYPSKQIDLITGLEGNGQIYLLQKIKNRQKSQTDGLLPRDQSLFILLYPLSGDLLAVEC